MTKRRNPTKRSRRHVSLRPAVYARLKAHCKEGGISMGQLIDTLLADLPEVTK